MAGFTAATISFGGLVAKLGITNSNGVSEKAEGLMVINNAEDFLTRTITSVPTGPTGPWYQDWWSVWNYLQYGVGGCLVGGTGTNTGTTTVGITYSTIHSTVEPFNIVFGCESINPSTTAGVTANRAAVSVATSRKDCFAVIGNTRDIANTSITSSYAGYTADFGILDGDWDRTDAGVTSANIIFVVGRKNYLQNWNSSISTSTSLGEINLAADVAGCFGRTASEYNGWSVPAGVLKGRILNSIALKTNYSVTEQTTMNDIRLSPVVTLPGRGTFFFGNTTGGPTSKSISNISFQSVLNYIKKTIGGLATELLFEPNNEFTRSAFTADANAILQGIKNAGNISQYQVICDTRNNSNAASSLTASITLYPINAIESVTLTVTNGSVSETYTI